MEPAIVRDPVYQQINQRLRSLTVHDYQPGQKLLTEREIVNRYAVSRGTANKALASLVSEGLLEFRKGVGTFVRRSAISYDLRTLVSFTEKARAVGKTPRTELLTFGPLSGAEVEPEIREALSLEDSARIWEMDRLRFIDDVPVILEHLFVVESFCPKLTKAQAEGSLYRAWTEVHGLTITGADEVIRAVLLSPREASRLQVRSRSPGLEVMAVGFVDDAQPLWWERTLYRADHYEFHSRLGPIQSAIPARGQLRTRSAK